ncbi:uncharacterized protein ASCRUDRAFT_75269 [Ascoidea rubescens DSM 1968]|uniref:Amino acid permease/ SLC12A domain-containing protein n=1 Tax=Ascoidea rubescens DSM 1968 TaxID=1344418 RepID=A0A1D2VKI2_9ASCO|nr:hypothetical protein ASCRUDRAFT_75269 [Ascoidea rubescens DSM 1968]ODV62047.1 hypothetical protein ASCRUDRAFT_75269 [Ascoidea rubescens DSM 1968]
MSSPVEVGQSNSSIEKKDIGHEESNIGDTSDSEEIRKVIEINGFVEKFNPELGNGTKRGLTYRQVMLMVIGSCIGSSLFISLSVPLVRYGSLALFIAFVFWAFVVIWPLMQAACEMASWLPIKGSFFHFVARFIDPALAFPVGVMYCYSTAIYVCVELVGFASLINYWPSTNVPIWSFILLGLGLNTIVNMMAVNWFGEIEFFASMFKILLIIGLMIFSFLSMCGANPKKDAYGFEHWSQGGLWKTVYKTGDTGRFLAFWNVFVYSAFSSGGPEAILIFAGEIRRPRRSVPLAGKTAFFRIYLFYIGGIFFMNTLCASNNPSLLQAMGEGKVGAGASPWVIGIKTVGVSGFSSLINAIIMTSLWSCGNAATYCSTRGIYAMSLAGYFPRFFSKCLKNGCPLFALLLADCFALLSFLATSNDSLTVYTWFISICSSSVLLVHSAIFLAHIRFRAAMKVQGLTNPYYETPFNVQPYTSYVGMFMCLLCSVFNGYWIFIDGEFLVSSLFTYYFSPVFFGLTYLFWKIWKKTSIIPLAEVDLLTGKKAIDREEQMEIDADEAAAAENKDSKGVFIGKKILKAIAVFLYSSKKGDLK